LLTLPSIPTRVSTGACAISDIMRTICFMGEVFRGSEALRDGRLTEHELRRWYHPIFRDVYVPRLNEPSLNDRIVGAWL
jgi:hypothetical protein